MVLVGLGVPALGANLLVNPSFEASSGFLTGWSNIGTAPSSSTQAHDGSVALVSGGSEIAQTITLQVGQTYELSLWAFSTSSVNTVRVSSVAVTPIPALLLRDSLSGTYQRISTTFVANNSSAYIRVLWNATGGTTTIDDLCLDVVGGACSVPVPEASAVSMALAGLALLATFAFLGSRSARTLPPRLARKTASGSEPSDPHFAAPHHVAMVLQQDVPLARFAEAGRV
jgi:hypothetical protein